MQINSPAIFYKHTTSCLIVQELSINLLTTISDTNTISTLTSANNTNSLDVIIGKQFNLPDHITFIKNKISKSIGIINKIRKFLN